MRSTPTPARHLLALAGLLLGAAALYAITASGPSQTVSRITGPGALPGLDPQGQVAHNPAASRAPAPTDALNATGLADLVERIHPAVVSVHTSWPAGGRDRNRSGAALEDFFGSSPLWPWSSPTEGASRSARGTGFLVSPDGLVMTSQHLVGNPGERQEIEVHVPLAKVEQPVAARLLDADPHLDAALLQLILPGRTAELPTVTLGDATRVRPGEWVVAVGNAAGESGAHSVSVGVITSGPREIVLQHPDTQAARTYPSLFLTDAAIHGANAGGPLLNMHGEVIGINTALTDDVRGIGSAVPISAVLEVLGRMLFRPGPDG